MSVGCTFGSFGDIITLAQLVAVVARELSGSCGSSEEYQALIAELDALQQALEIASAAVQPLLALPTCSAGISALQREVALCGALVKQLQRNIAGYQKPLGQRGSRMRFQERWRSMGWQLFKKPELITVRARLSTHRDAITLLVSLLTCQHSQQAGSRLVHLDRNVSDILQLLRHRPQSLGYSWEGGHDDDHKPVRMIDALDRRYKCPWECVETPDQLLGMLRVSFASQHPLIRDCVNEWSINITTHDPSISAIPTRLTAENWLVCMRPGVVVSMELKWRDFIVGPVEQLSDESSYRMPRFLVGSMSPWLGYMPSIDSWVLHELCAGDSAQALSEFQELREAGFHCNTDISYILILPPNPFPTEVARHQGSADLLMRRHYQPVRHAVHTSGKDLMHPLLIQGSSALLLASAVTCLRPTTLATAHPASAEHTQLENIQDGILSAPEHIDYCIHEARIKNVRHARQVRYRTLTEPCLDGVAALFDSSTESHIAQDFDSLPLA